MDEEIFQSVDSDPLNSFLNKDKNSAKNVYDDPMKSQSMGFKQDDIFPQVQMNGFASYQTLPQMSDDYLEKNTGDMYNCDPNGFAFPGYSYNQKAIPSESMFRASNYYQNGFPEMFPQPQPISPHYQQMQNPQKMGHPQQIQNREMYTGRPITDPFFKQGVSEQEFKVPNHYNPSHKNQAIDRSDEDYDEVFEPAASSSKRIKKDKKKRGSPGRKASNTQNPRLEKNKISARESRKRKKMYVQSLEGKVDELEAEIERLKIQLAAMKEREQLGFLSKNESISQLITGRENLIDRLEKTLERRDSCEEMEDIIDALQVRSGGSGVERRNALSYVFKKIIDIAIPIYLKFLIWRSSDGNSVFSDCSKPPIEELVSMNMDKKRKNKKFSKYEKYEIKLRIESEARMDEWSEIENILSLTPIQKQRILEIASKIEHQGDNIKKSIQELLVVKKDLFEKTSVLQNIASEMRSFLSPDQVAKFLIWVEKKKDKKELDIENIWGLDSDSDELDENIESKVKIEDPSIHIKYEPSYTDDANYTHEENSDCILS